MESREDRSGALDMLRNRPGVEGLRVVFDRTATSISGGFESLEIRKFVGEQDPSIAPIFRLQTLSNGGGAF